MNLIEIISRRTEYRPDGVLVWTFLPRRKERIGMDAGSISSTDGYVYIKSEGKRVGAHRVVFFKHHGYVPVEVDHINRIRSDNRIENLRDAITHNNNCGNQSHQTGRSSKYKGVCWDKNRNKWIVAIKVNRKAKYLGRYKNEEDAARAYNAAASIYFGEFANINEV
jgi:AP2 domain.